LKQEGYTIFSVEQAEGSLSLEKMELEPDQKVALVFGHEIRGVDQKVLDHSHYCLEIPQYGTKHSLNISVSAGIVIWEVFRKFTL